MIVGFIGDIGQGKTCSMVAYAYAMHKKGYEIYANFRLNFPFRYLTLADILRYYEEETAFKNTIFLIDEIHMLIDSRTAMTRRNMIISYFILQTRKKGVILMWTSQHYHQVEKRLRASTDAFVECYHKSKSGQSFVLNIFNIVKTNRIITKKIMFNPVPIYDLYNTYEIIKPI